MLMCRSARSPGRPFLSTWQEQQAGAAELLSHLPVRTCSLSGDVAIVLAGKSDAAAAAFYVSGVATILDAPEMILGIAPTYGHPAVGHVADRPSCRPTGYTAWAHRLLASWPPRSQFGCGVRRGYS
jgi:hypothetical protein